MLILGAYVHVSARHEVAVIKPVGREDSTENDTGQCKQALDDNNADPWWTIHDCIGSLAWLPNEPAIHCNVFLKAHCAWGEV